MMINFGEVPTLLLLDGAERRSFSDQLIRDIFGINDSTISVETVESLDGGSAFRRNASEFSFEVGDPESFGEFNLSVTLSDGSSQALRILRIEGNKDETIDFSRLGFYPRVGSELDPIVINSRPVIGTSLESTRAAGIFIEETGQYILTQELLAGRISDVDGDGISSEVIGIRTNPFDGPSTPLSYEKITFEGEIAYLVDERFGSLFSQVVVDHVITDSTNGNPPFILTSFYVSERENASRGNSSEDYRSVSIGSISAPPAVSEHSVSGLIDYKERSISSSRNGQSKIVIYGSDGSGLAPELDVNAIDIDSIMFGDESIDADSLTGVGVSRKRNGDYRVKYKDINKDGIEDLIVRAVSSDLAGAAGPDSQEIFGFATSIDGTVKYQFGRELPGESILEAMTSTEILA